jgi:hypothetical protein
MKIKNVKNKALVAVATTVGTAGAIVAAAASGVGLPVAIVAFAKQVVTWGTLFGIIAAKALPGNGKNAPQKDARGQVRDDEDPR